MNIHQSIAFSFHSGRDQIGSDEEFADESGADTESEMDAGMGATELEAVDVEVRLYTEGRCPLSGFRIPIACTHDKKLRNRKFCQSLT